MTLIDIYNTKCREQRLVRDTRQLEVLSEFQRLTDELVAASNASFFQRFFNSKPIQGIYIWGGVGIGKTFLMDIFFNALPIKNKVRQHYHAFMRSLHQELKVHQGKADPLQFIIKQFAKTTSLLCLDELHVTDIVDAMLLRKLFEALMSNGITLVTTSNVEPDNLYKNGLQRPSFLPAIAILKKNLRVIHLSSQQDYRMTDLIHDPDKIYDNELDILFKKTTLDAPYETAPITILGREITIIKASNDIIWFDFDVICKPPRSQLDYLAIAEKYTTVFISHIRRLQEDENNQARLFIRMIDVFYDMQIKLIISSAIPIEDIYVSGILQFEFKRTFSRLNEMLLASRTSLD